MAMSRSERGRRGGFARAAALTPEQRSEIGRKAGLATAAAMPAVIIDAALTKWSQLRPPRDWEAYRAKWPGRILRAYEEVHNMAVERGDARLAAAILRDMAALVPEFGRGARQTAAVAVEPEPDLSGLDEATLAKLRKRTGTAQD